MDGLAGVGVWVDVAVREGVLVAGSGVLVQVGGSEIDRAVGVLGIFSFAREQAEINRASSNIFPVFILLK
jgi:hypothetical protein